jgi:exodeoxyribonuclease V alpha subunit
MAPEHARMSAAPPPEREALAGLVERVTYHNPANGFGVLRVKLRGQRELVTVVGAAAAISAGELVQASGTWVNDRTHGLQFKAASSAPLRRPRSKASRRTSPRA